MGAGLDVLLASMGWEKNLVQDAWKLAVLAGRRGRKGGGLLALQEGKEAHKYGGWTDVLGEMTLSVLN